MSSVRNTVIKATGVIAIASALSKILGFVREMSIAYQFGSTWQTDAFNIAHSIPGLLFAAVATAIRTVFIPVFTDVATHKGKDKAMELANNVINTTLLISFILIVAGEIFAGPLVRLFARGFEGETFDLAVSLTRVMIPTIVFLGLIGIVSGILNALQKFTAPALVGFPYNILIIAGIFTLGSYFGIYGLAIATFLGIGSQLLILLPSLKKTGFRYKFYINLKSPEIVLILELMVPTLISTAMGEINVMVDKMLASGLPEGSISALSYANRLYALPIGIVVSAVVTAIYPTMSQAAATKNRQQFVSSVDSSIRIMSFLVLPMMIGLLVLTTPIVQVVYERGAFGPSDSIQTATALFFYSLGLLAASWREVINRGFWSMKNTLIPMFISAGAVITNIAFNFILVGSMGHGGLALATTLSVIVAAGLGLIFLRKKTGPIGLRSVMKSLFKCIIASLIMGIVAYFSWGFASPFATSRTIRAILLFAVIGLSAITYFGVCYLLKVEEMAFAGKLAKRIFGKFSKR
ncbi:MAG: murein biosynthesis integral membrane protein MurJ [Firmicutes bacterium]|nr:murein biosynthesis integral membrane protein MurJ [Bacillota bacterium]MDD4693805.1 murein biosynthesis integral membrane protein MurJ [Bacillota bacterium]